jgi:hypothetical protein
MNDNLIIFVGRTRTIHFVNHDYKGKEKKGDLVIIFLRVPTTFSSTSRLLQPCESDIDRLAHKRKNLKLSLRRYLV